MRLMSISYAGDFLNDFKRIFEQQGKENYYGQKYSIETFLDLANSGYELLDLSLHVSKGYNEMINPRFQVIGLNGNLQSVQNIIKSFGPDKVILRTPDLSLLMFLRHRKIPTFPIFADSFGEKPWYRIRSKLKQIGLSRELKHESIKWIGNHQINASKSLMSLGISPAKILPYDWLHSDIPENWLKEKSLGVAGKTIRLFYAGQISRIKGLYDLIDAVRMIKKQNRKIILVIAGRKTEELINYIKQKNLNESIELLGVIDHDTVLEQMHCAHAVVVPSHHAYPEGLPMTIMEGLMTNTPVIASDHPMFVGRCDKYGAVTFFKQQNPNDIAEKILFLMQDDEHYYDVQQNTSKEWHHLCLDLKFADMINHWVNDSKTNLFEKNTLLRYLDFNHPSK